MALDVKRYVGDLQAIVDQLEFCNYQTGDGLHSIGNNSAFIALKEMAACQDKDRGAGISPNTTHEAITL